MTPPADLNAPLLAEYSPPTIEIVVGALIPVMVAALEVTGVEATAFVTDAKLKGSGVISGAMRMVPMGRSVCVSIVGGRLLPGF